MSNESLDRDALLQVNLQLGRELSARTLMFHGAVSDRIGLSAVEHKALDLLSRAGALTAGQLSSLTGLTTGAITGLVDRLEKAGFVQRERDPSDRRKVVIQPVLEKMEAEIAPLFFSMGQQMEALLSSYSDQELAVIQDFVSRSIAVLQTETTRLSTDASSEGDS